METKQLKLSNIIENIELFESRIKNNSELFQKYSDFIKRVKSNTFFNILTDTIFMLFDDISNNIINIFDYSNDEYIAISNLIKTNEQIVFKSLFDKLQNQKYKNPINKKFLEINLLEKSKDFNNEYEEKFNIYKSKINGFTNINKELNLKTGDIIKFISGMNNDIIYTSKILGFDSEGLAYMLWDCYWFPINLKERLVSKENNIPEKINISTNLKEKFKSKEKEKFKELINEYNSINIQLNELREKYKLNKKSFSLQQIILKYQSKQNSILENLDRIEYGHNVIKTILKELNLMSSKSESTNIRGFNHFSKGYSFNKYDSSLISFLHISFDEFNNIVNQLILNGFEIISKSEPSKIISGGTSSSISIDKLYKFRK